MIFNFKSGALILTVLCFGFLSCTSTPVVKTHHTLPPKKRTTQPTPTPQVVDKRASPQVVSSTTPTVINVAIKENDLAQTQQVGSGALPPPAEVLAPPTFSIDKESAETKKLKSEIQYSTDPKKIGVILPLSGKNSSIGQHALTAIRLGLGLMESAPLLSIALFDSEGNPELAAQGVEKLLKDNNVIAIMGGLGAKEAQAIAARADFFEVPFFTFSQKSGLTENSDYVFRNSVTPEMQINKLVDFAFKRMNAKKFAILFPNDSYGVEFANQFWDHVLARGGTVVAAQTYDPKETDLSTYVQKLVGTYYPEARENEYQERLQEIKDKKKKKLDAGVKKKTRENEAKENILDPIVDFDAIFIPDSGRTLGQTIAFMKSADVGDLTYLGTNLWNTPDLVRRAGHQANRIFFVDSVINDGVQKESQFYQKYFAINQEEPTLVEAQTYEAAKVLRDLLGGGTVGRESLAAQLRTLGRRPGAFDEIYMNNNREIERPLSILGLSQGIISKEGLN